MGKGAGEPGQGPEIGTADAAETVELHVEGMHCQACVALIEETLAGDPGVQRATVDLDTARASVTFEPATVSVADLCAAVTTAGYAATALRSGDRTP